MIFRRDEPVWLGVMRLAAWLSFPVAILLLMLWKTMIPVVVAMVAAPLLALGADHLSRRLRQGRVREDRKDLS